MKLYHFFPPAPFDVEPRFRFPSVTFFPARQRVCRFKGAAPGTRFLRGDLRCCRAASFLLLYLRRAVLPASEKSLAATIPRRPNSTLCSVDCSPTLVQLRSFAYFRALTAVLHFTLRPHFMVRCPPPAFPLPRSGRLHCSVQTHLEALLEFLSFFQFPPFLLHAPMHIHLFFPPDVPASSAVAEVFQKVFTSDPFFLLPRDLPGVLSF